MSKRDKRFEDFAEGDYVTFRKVFTATDFARFSDLSGDANPLHHDAAYAARTPFGHTIVPLHLVTMPLSAVAGMMLPGHRSLYLGLQTRAIEPVPYDEEITYSARVVSTHPAQQMLSVRVIAFSGNSVVLEADMQVKVREDIPRDGWLEPAAAIRNSRIGRTALVTGAGGHIGRAIARKLAIAGWNLVLAYNGSEAEAERLEKECRSRGVHARSVKADLSEVVEVRDLLNEENGVVAVVHAASPPVDASAQSLFSVNFSALKVLTEQALPEMLARQYGRVLMIGSSAMQYSPRGWEDYVASKAAATSFVEAVRLRYSKYGIGAVTLAPGFVHTPFSEGARDPSRLALMPEEVAEAACRLLEQSVVENSYAWLEPQSAREGQFGFHQGRREVPAPKSTPDTPEVHQVMLDSTESESRLDEFVRRFFHLSSDADLWNAGLNLTPGWDSLRHIEFMLDLEAKLGLRFSAAEVEQTARYAELRKLVEAKRA